MTINCLYLLFILTFLAGRIARIAKSRLLSACLRRKLTTTPPYALRKSACLLSTIHCCLVELYLKFNPVQSSEEDENKDAFFRFFSFEKCMENLKITEPHFIPSTLYSISMFMRIQK